jgi:hypothetical protein
LGLPRTLYCMNYKVYDQLWKYWSLELVTCLFTKMQDFDDVER